MERSVILYGVGSPIVVDVEESLRRLGYRIVAAVQNVDSDVWLMDRGPLISREAVSHRELAHPIVVPLFAPGHRQFAALEARAMGFMSSATVVDPTSVTPSRWVIGQGVYVNGGCTFGAAVTLGDFVFVNRGAVVGHHVALAAFVSIGPGAVLGGQVSVALGAFVGAGAVLLPGVRVGANSVVGAGAVVTKDVPEHSLAIGTPARVVKSGIAGYRDQSVT